MVLFISDFAVFMSYDKEKHNGHPMFHRLSESLSNAFASLRKPKVLTQDDIQSALRKIRIALLDADVDFDVIRTLVKDISEHALGQTVLKSLQPDQMLVSIVNDVLIQRLQPAQRTLSIRKPYAIMMIGLQGAGKTTMCSKIAFTLKEQGHRVLLASTDVHRPAARQQLAVLGQSIGVDTLPIVDSDTAMDCARRTMDAHPAYDVTLVDTAGRLHVDATLMQELTDMHNLIRPHHTMLTVDALAGHDTVPTLQAFEQSVPIHGVCLSRIDADSRGGVALSLYEQSKKPIYFMGTGEKPADVMPFDAQRIANRILDKGDIVALVEKAKQSISATDQERSIDRLKKGLFNLNDFAKQLDHMHSMGGISKILSFLPGMGAVKQDIKDKINSIEWRQKRAIISSMTHKERILPSLLNAQRKKRIAKGAGVDVMAVNRLLKEFDQMQKMVRHFKNMPMA